MNTFPALFYDMKMNQFRWICKIEKKCPCQMSTLIHKLLIKVYTKSFTCLVCRFFSIRNSLEGYLSNQPDSDVFPVCYAIKTPCSAFLFCEICPSSYLNLWFMLWNRQKVCAAGLCSALIAPNLSDLYPKTSNIGLSAVGALGDYSRDTN